MNLDLKPFQTDAIADLHSEVGDAVAEADKRRKQQAIILTSPTGSGKTVMMTRLIELVLRGEEGGDAQPDPNACFLWITDQPALNEQTRRKILAASDELTEDDLVTIEAATFDQEELDTGKVYFLNTQKLGKNSNLVQVGDKNKREHSLWETIANTARQRTQDEEPVHLWVVINEAHRGMNETDKDRAAAQSIVQKLIKGSPDDGLAPVPLIIGVSATPERFAKLLAGTRCTTREIGVDPKRVRNSGLLKDEIVLYYPAARQASDLTLLSVAATSVKTFEEEWGAHAAVEGEAAVQPLLVVQVQDGTEKKLTKTDLAAAITTVEGVLGPLDEDAVAHCFQEASIISVGGRPVRYVNPSDVETDPLLRVVFFKMSLTTGWDCPRAEVMMSFRTAHDDTLIAQLVGRMVRTPLAHKIKSTQINADLLNSVRLYLPYYDRKAVKAIIAKLSSDDEENGIAGGTKVTDGTNRVTLLRDDSPDIDEVFTKKIDVHPGIPSYELGDVTTESKVRKLLKLGRFLAWDKLDDKATDAFKTALVAKLESERARVSNDPRFKDLFNATGRVAVQATSVAWGSKDSRDLDAQHRALLDANVEQSFAEAGRRLTGGLHSDYLQYRVKKNTKGTLNVPVVKRELCALLQDDAVITAVEDEAARLCKKYAAKYQDSIDQLNAEKQSKYRDACSLGSDPIPKKLRLPPSIESSKTGTIRSKHLYVPESGEYRCSLGGWEEDVIAEELRRSDFIAWLRNDPNAQWALMVPYEHDGKDHPMFPDFLVFRREDERMVCDVLEPHALREEDSYQKVRGLAKFAKKHADRFGRVEFITKLKKDEPGFKRVDLGDPVVREKFARMEGSGNLRQFIEEL